MNRYTMTGIVLVVLLLGMSTAVAYDSPTLVTYTITNTTIESPKTTSIDVAFSEYVSATIKIENASGNLVKELYSNSNVKNPNAKIWDGTYTDGTSVPDDTYTVNVTGVNTTTGLSVINITETITVVTSGDTTPPTVDANTPTGTDVAISTTITATFSEVMNQTSAEDAFSINPLATGSFSWADDTVTFTPDADLAYDTTYNVTVGTGAEDLAGNPLAEDFTWNFTTGSATATDTVTRTLQATAAPNDAITVSLTIDFDDVAAVNKLAITETVPDGWVVIDASAAGDFTTTPGKVTWVKVDAFGTLPPDGAVFKYNVTVPTDADGMYSFSGVYGTNVAGTNLDILGDANITIGGVTEVCDDEIDNDGDGLVDCDDPDCSVDADGDGYYALPCGDDCDDTNAAVNPGATEVENGIDDDCDGQIDEGCGPCDFYLELDAGWNFVSVPKRIDGANDAITVFNIDPVNETCEYYTSAGSGMDLVDICVVPCQGYWVWKVNPETICINFKESTGATPPPAQQLYAGWNMIGHIDTSDMPIDDGTGTDFGSMVSIEGKFLQIWQWTQESGWESCYPSGINSMTPGQGYWIWMTEDAMMSGTP